MTMQLLATGLGVILGAGMMVAAVQPGIDLLRAIIGKNRCYGGDVLNGCSTWGNGTLLCGVVVFFAWPRWGFAALAFVPLVPVAAILFWTGYYCFLAHRARRREFAVRDGVIVRLADGTRLEPQFAIPSTWYNQTGPATGYGGHILRLGSDDVIMATNTYVDHELAQCDLRAVLAVAGPAGCRSVSLAFTLPRGPQEWQSVCLEPDWTPLLCGPLQELPEADRAWWRQWLQPTFGLLGRRTVPTSEVGAQLENLVTHYPWLLTKNPAGGPDHEKMPSLNALMGTIRTHDTIRALRALLARDSMIEVSTHQAHQETLGAARGRQRWIEVSFDHDGVQIESVHEPENRGKKKRS